MTSNNDRKQRHPLNLSRRRFLTQASAAAVSATLVPRHVLGGVGHTPPSETLNVAIIGAGGQGLHNMRALLQEDDVQIV
ncbi:MAG: twin-arginine translocation signal domain-containing protein, partial [Planctomycetes bacterium]|nr:twin-arginine translocation signal domain-containing protein [Planctomycetota bacterium]